jgi:hypothetical protein
LEKNRTGGFAAIGASKAVNFLEFFLVCLGKFLIELLPLEQFEFAKEFPVSAVFTAAF